AKLASLVLAVMFGSALSSEWNTFLVWQNAAPFGRQDPIFGLDLGFYVFTLPWLSGAVNFLFGLVTLTTILTAGIYFGLQSLAAVARVELSRPAIRAHSAVL